jgi:Tfp pilus assembly protein PilX
MTRTLPHRQRGMTLLVGLVMLVLLLMMAVSAFNISRTNTAITGNMQNKMEATHAAMQATEEVISTTRFIDTPNNALPGNQLEVDVNADGKTDITVTLAPPPCIKKIVVIKNASLNLSNPDDIPCALGVSQSLGVSGAATGDSLCAASVWEITANATDAVTQAQSTVVTGVAVRVSADEALDPSVACP